MFRLRLFQSLLLSVFSPLAAFAFASTSHGAMQLVSDGKSSAVIVAPTDVSAPTKRAIDDLVRYVRQSTGAALPLEKSSANNRAELHIGLTDYVRSLKLPAEDLGIDGFKILFPAPNRIVLIGGSESGTEVAIYEFLERYIGVRWLFPGELGTFVPVARDIAIPTGEVVSRPAYISRTISTFQECLPGQPVDIWLQRQRRHWTIQHHHNLDKLFPPSKYLATHPEYFPTSGGKPIVPDQDAQNWQPMLDADGLVDEAVKTIDGYFDKYPQNPSFSLGINDTNNFGRPSEYKNSVGLADYSDLYYGFANRVIEGVLKKHPDKWFGCLAYLGVTDPPQNVQLNPRMVPHICIDKQRWANEECAKRDMERTEKWHKAAPVLGWYDYIYGDDHYRIPRIYSHLMGRYLKFGSEQGVKSMYAEYYGSPAWIDGPKMYVFMKLLWNPSADVDAMLAEWYRLAVGEKAAAPLAKYFQFWEDYWSKRVPETDWFKQYADGVYFDFDHTGYLDPLTAEDLSECKRLLSEVVASAETPDQKKRAEFIAKGFNDALHDVDYEIRLRGKTVTAEVNKAALLSDSFVPPPASEVATDQASAIPPAWGGWQNEPGTARLYWDHATGCNDSHCLAIDAKNAGMSVVFYREFPIDKPQPLYHYGASIRCDGVNADACVGIEVRWTRKDGKYLPRKYTSNSFTSAKNYKDGAWVPLDVFSRPPTETEPYIMSVRLSAIHAREGTIRFDDVTLAPLSEEQTTSR